MQPKRCVLPGSAATAGSIAMPGGILASCSQSLVLVVDFTSIYLYRLEVALKGIGVFRAAHCLQPFFFSETV